MIAIPESAPKPCSCNTAAERRARAIQHAQREKDKDGTHCVPFRFPAGGEPRTREDSYLHAQLKIVR
jgi:hypothetical protein